MKGRSLPSTAGTGRMCRKHGCCRFPPSRAERRYVPQHYIACSSARLLFTTIVSVELTSLRSLWSPPPGPCCDGYDEAEP